VTTRVTRVMGVQEALEESGALVVLGVLGRL
jgi:hypothetical protein